MHEIEPQADVDFSRTSVFLHVMLTDYTLLGVEGMAVRMAVREELSLLSGLIICEIVNSVGQGNFTFVRKKSGNFRNHWLWQPCLMRGIYTVGVGVDLMFNILKKTTTTTANPDIHEGVAH